MYPSMTPVRAYELSQPGLLIQADCIAMTSICVAYMPDNQREFHYD